MELLRLVGGFSHWASSIPSGAREGIGIDPPNSPLVEPEMGTMIRVSAIYGWMSFRRCLRWNKHQNMRVRSCQMLPIPPKWNRRSLSKWLGGHHVFLYEGLRAPNGFSQASGPLFSLVFERTTVTVRPETDALFEKSLTSV